MTGLKPKTLKRLPWSSTDEPITVHLAITGETGNRRMHVHLGDGTYIGTLYEYWGALDRNIPGTRLRRPGKRRILWAYYGPDQERPPYLQALYSQAEAIRRLLDDHDARTRKQKGA